MKTGNAVRPLLHGTGTVGIEAGEETIACGIVIHPGRAGAVIFRRRGIQRPPKGAVRLPLVCDLVGNGFHRPSIRPRLGVLSAHLRSDRGSEHI